MRCEVIAIGTELLLGTVIDTNSSWIGEQLALAGIDHHYQSKVGDNFARIEGALRLALERSDAVVCCGGLGPTQDDITRDVIARVMGVSVVRDEAMAAKIRNIFEGRGRVMTLNNLRQADIPVGAYPIPQMPGTAPGLVCPIGDKVIYAVPGVPSEMREMMTGTVIPDIRRRSGQSSVIISRTIRTWGLSESGIDEMLTDHMAELDKTGNPTIAFNASGIEGIKVRITAKCDDVATATRMLNTEEQKVRAVLGDAVFGIDDQSMEAVVLDRLRAKSLTLAAAETLSGGILSSRMSALDPMMTTFVGATIGAEQSRDGESPQQRAISHAEAIRNGFGASIGIAASPPPPELGEPPGTVYFAMADGSGETRTSRTVLPGDRRRMREYSVISLLNFVRQELDRTPG